MINEVSNQTGIPFKSDNLMGLFDLFVGDTGNRFARGGSTPGGLQLEQSGKYTLYFGGSSRNFDPTTPLGRVVVNDHGAQVTRHELIHFAASGGVYNDPQLALAAANTLKLIDAPRWEAMVP